MKQGLWAPFRVRILPPGELPADGELWIALSSIGMELDEMDLEISTPPIVPVMRAISQGCVPSSIAVEDTSAQTTSALAVAMGVSVPVDVCKAAVLYDTVGPDAVERSLRILIEGYYGYRENVCARERQRRQPSEDRILRRMLRYWRRIINDPQKVCSFASVGRQLREQLRLGVTSIDRDSSSFCVVHARDWAFPVGFIDRDTVVLVQTDDWGHEKVAIGTVAKNRDFMRQLRIMLSRSERATRVAMGVSARKCGWRISDAGDYITPPRKKKGSVLSPEQILEIVSDCVV